MCEIQTPTFVLFSIGIVISLYDITSKPHPKQDVNEMANFYCYFLSDVKLQPMVLILFLPSNIGIQKCSLEKNSDQ